MRWGCYPQDSDSVRQWNWKRMVAMNGSNLINTCIFCSKQASLSHRSHNNKQPNSKTLHKDPVRKHLQWHKRPPTKFHNCRKRQFEKKQAQKANDTHTRRQKQRKISPAPQECKLECFLRIRRCQHSLKSILWNTQPSIQYSLPHEATVTQKGKRQKVDDFST